MPFAAQPALIAGVPVLIARPQPSDRPLPVVFWVHGFTADALAHAAELERCAAAGFLAIGIDAVGHGARLDPGMSARIDASPAGALPVMLDIVEATVAELPALIDGVADLFAIDRARLSMVGISMGAFLAYRSIVTGPSLRSVVALLGSPVWPRTSSPHQSQHRFQAVALLSVTAEFDVSVPPDPVRRFHQSLRSAFPTSARHHHHELRGAGHLTSAAEWAEAMDSTVYWLQRYG